ncbi:hypothetical protein [Flavihumibacter solisilvae]|uniref:Outer membrane protein beta-barrel domain-containing protein n=1 Tax=Flavihumibacter solisilvae TaxID=1349421 RepID=A0A0C1LC14_9BACT|nr:hypothetical protein [Flavihumibacter solisilvae]KIC93038.1 hypothetical protein OI18_20045 [Flavihumibacter solisilvae]
MKLIPLIVFLSASLASCAQEKKEFKSRHSIGLNIGHEHSFSGKDENGDRKVAVLAYWGLDYNFQFAARFAVGLHTDYIIESFKIEKDLAGADNEVVERSHPIAPALMGIFKPNERWSFGLGMGAEFAKEENYALNRLAVEYGAEIRNGWEVFGVLQYDIRWNAYDTWTIGLGISKTFGKER